MGGGMRRAGLARHVPICARSGRIERSGQRPAGPVLPLPAAGRLRTSSPSGRSAGVPPVVGAGRSRSTSGSSPAEGRLAAGDRRAPGFLTVCSGSGFSSARPRRGVGPVAGLAAGPAQQAFPGAERVAAVRLRVGLGSGSEARFWAALLTRQRFPTGPSCAWRRPAGLPGPRARRLSTPPASPWFSPAPATPCSWAPRGATRTAGPVDGQPAAWPVSQPWPAFQPAVCRSQAPGRSRSRDGSLRNRLGGDLACGSRYDRLAGYSSPPSGSLQNRKQPERQKTKRQQTQRQQMQRLKTERSRPGRSRSWARSAQRHSCGQLLRRLSVGGARRCCRSRGGRRRDGLLPGRHPACGAGGRPDAKLAFGFRRALHFHGRLRRGLVAPFAACHRSHRRRHPGRPRFSPPAPSLPAG